MDFDPQVFEEDEFEEHELEEPPVVMPRQRDVSDEEIIEERDKLFVEGSDFKPIDRSHIVGIDDVLNETDEIIHWLQNSAQYMEWKARLEPGIILAGSPGTGKTTTARYIATKSSAFFVNVRDFSHKGNLFADSDIRDLFRRSREKYAATKKPVVLFWDEFEGVAAERSGDRTTPDQAAVVSQLTSELEGALGKNEGILLIGCTNYLNNIDHALRRAGRLGVQFEFTAPDRKGKQTILSFYIGQTNAAPDLDTETLSHFFDKDATAADIEEACQEAWRNAVSRFLKAGDPEGVTEPYLNQDDLIKVFVKRLVGPPTTYKVPAEERIRIAIHEIGHAIVAMAYRVKVRLITVQPGKKALGRVMTDDMMEYIGTKEEQVDWIRVGAGGIAAERTAGLPEMIGCTGDIASINQHVQRVIDKMGYGKTTGLFNASEYERPTGRGYGGPNPSISQEAILRSDRECKRLVDKIEREANEVLEAVGNDALWVMARRLEQAVTMTGAELLALFEETTGNLPTAYRPGSRSDLELVA